MEKAKTIEDAYCIPPSLAPDFGAGSTAGCGAEKEFVKQPDAQAAAHSATEGSRFENSAVPTSTSSRARNCKQGIAQTQQRINQRKQRKLNRVRVDELEVQHTRSIDQNSCRGANE
jgi:hypothetical protein